MLNGDSESIMRRQDMGWKEVAAGIGTQGTVSALKAAEGRVSKRKYKRLIATAVAELLVLHPDIGPRKARRRARRLTGAKPSKKLMRAGSNLGWKQGAEGVVAAAATAGIAKVAGVVGEKLKDKLGDGRKEGEHQAREMDRASRTPTSVSEAEDPPGTRH
jgi:hypothetical protein